MLLSQALEGRPSEFEFESADSERAFASSFSPLRGASGDIEALIGVTQDVTARRRAEAVLRASEERYRELFENASEAIVTCDLDGRITSLNPAAQALAGLEIGAAIGRPLTDVIAGPEPTAPYLAATPADTLAAQVGRDPGRLRIGVQIGTVITPDPDPEAKAAVDAAVAALTALGHEVEILDELPYDDHAMSTDFLLTWFASVAADVAEVKALTGSGDDGFERDTLVMAALGRATSAPEYVAAVNRRHDHIRRLATFFASYDLLLSPTVAKVPPRIGALDLAKPLALAADLLLKTRTAGLLSYTPIVDDMVKQNLGWVPYTQLANITGRPAISVPVHQTPDGIPMGAQLLAPLGGEGLLIQVAAQLEESIPWADRRPPLG